MARCDSSGAGKYLSVLRFCGMVISTFAVFIVSIFGVFEEWMNWKPGFSLQMQFPVHEEILRKFMTFYAKKFSVF